MGKLGEKGIKTMWMRASEREILAAIEAGDLIETATFDAKVSLPARGRSKDLAIVGSTRGRSG